MERGSRSGYVRPLSTRRSDRLFLLRLPLQGGLSCGGISNLRNGAICPRLAACPMLCLAPLQVIGNSAMNYRIANFELILIRVST